MKTIFATLAAATAIAAVAAPAAAQPYGADRDRYEHRGSDDGYRWNDSRWDRGRDSVNARQARLERGIEYGVRRGLLSRNETRQLRHDVYSIARLEATYRINGLNSRERAELDHRLDWAERRLEGRLENREYSAGYGARR